MNNNTKASIYALISGLLYSLLGYFGIKIVEANFTIFNMLFWRFFIAALFMSILTFFKQKSEPLSLKYIIKSSIILGAVYSIGSAIYFLAAKYIGTGLAMVIFFTYPMFVILYNWQVRKQKVSRQYILASIFILFGMAFLIDKNEINIDLWGIFLSIISALFYASYIIVSKQQTKNLSTLTASLIVNYGASFTCFIICLFEQTIKIPHDISLSLNIIGVSIICTALPILLLLNAMKYLSAEKTAILSVFEPLGVYLIGVTLLNEQISSLKIFGIILILSSAIIVQI
jgi:drug/metabolite transporter (DMT)-like permease